MKKIKLLTSFVGVTTAAGLAATAITGCSCGQTKNNIVIEGGNCDTTRSIIELNKDAMIYLVPPTGKSITGVKLVKVADKQISTDLWSFKVTNSVDYLLTIKAEAMTSTQVYVEPEFDKEFTGIEISKTTANIAVGESFKIKASISYSSNAQTITWSQVGTSENIVTLSKSVSSSDEEITVTGVSAGAVTLKATAGVYSKECTIQVGTPGPGTVKFTISFITSSDKGQGEITKGDSTYKCYEDSIEWKKIASPTVKYKPTGSEEKVFSGWYTEQSCTNRVPDDKVFNSDTKLYAGYVESSIGEAKDYLYTYTDSSSVIWMYDYQTIEANSGSVVRYNMETWEAISIDRDKFNEPIAIGNKVSAIGDSFLNNCSAFNQSITIPTSITTIGEDFLWNCRNFNQNLVIPSSINSLGAGFLNNCYSMKSIITINCPSSAILKSDDDETCAMDDKTTTAFVTGIQINGSSADQFMGVFKNRTDTSIDCYRKLIKVS